MRNIAKYTTKPIEYDPGMNVTDNVLHYMAIVPLDEETRFLLVPTQGMLIHLGEQDGSPVWAYLRWHRAPFFISIFGGHTIDTISPSVVRGELFQRAAVCARQYEVFDRRHVRIDEDYPTPGQPSNAV